MIDPFAELVHARGCGCADCQGARPGPPIKFAAPVVAAGAPVICNGELMFRQACDATSRREFVMGVTSSSLRELDAYLERKAVLTGTPGDLWADVIHEIRRRWLKGGAQ
ncbi:hypothetical protein [Luteolibacter sp. LG18]|uniref:hypothetical protein n=1 Tax=Luteolibacter sp. LG18 TaxID=2819286 RepID=UPI002B29EC6A|nr:hypothetical protein llg_07150 [Luteolibacter sp. LG18]BCU79656.1 hypothetical protein llg_43710 [Luteolibacter sp. LG18]